MSRKDGIIDLVVKTQPFRDIERGFKLEEYRQDKPGETRWRKRLLTDIAFDLRPAGLYELRPDFDFHDYHTARFSLGYAADRPSFLRPIKRIRWGLPNPAWTYGIVTGEPCFIIELGEP